MTPNGRILFLGLTALCCLFRLPAASAVNNRPIIGVLAQERQGGKSQYFAASYVKWIEMGGAQAAPIFVGMNDSYYEELFSHINGVLLPGGGTNLVQTKYADASDRILETVLQKHKHGIHFPVWASCLSFEKLITYYLNDTEAWESDCYVENTSLNLEFLPNVNIDNVRMLNKNQEIYDILREKNVTANYHQICMKKSTFIDSKNLTDNFVLVSTNLYDGMEFVSTIEHRTLPIYATQWHPEKNQFEWLVHPGLGSINHDQDAIRVGQHFGNFFISEARKNDQRFDTGEQEYKHLIYSFDSYRKPTNYEKSSFVETFEFPLPFEL